MSCEPPVSGRVSAIKSQFESLSSVESLDISGIRSKKPSVRFQFQRAATSFDLTNRHDKIKDVVKTWSSPPKNEVPKQHSDSALLEQHRRVSKQPVNSNRPALKRCSKETTEVKLSRHTSDPVKRSSIKRSPAFRVGEKQNKAILIKQTSLTEDKTVEDTKFEKFLARNYSKTNMERFQQAGLSDSLKAALRQPLPVGPPPKKPPRTFCGSPTSVPEEKALFDSGDGHDPSDSATSGVHIQERINFLETNLAMKSGPKTHLPAVKFRTPLQKSKTELVLQGTKFLNCISCLRDSTPVYDSVGAYENESKPLILQKSRTTCLTGKPHEPIYMEPFGHLKSNNRQISRCSNFTKETENVNTNTNDKKISNGNSVASCSCPENHKSTDSHYLCTAIKENSGDADSAEKEASFSLEKTYDEISILLNAAFQQKIPGNDCSTMNSKDNNSDDNEIRSSTRLSRSMTEKRKDYVRRVSCVPNRQINNYGTVHRTFKPTNSKASTNINDSKNNNEPATELFYENIIKTSDRINKYNQLVEKSSKSSPLLAKKHEDRQVQSAEEEDIYEIGMSENDNTPKLFQVCILVGYNTSTGSAYVKLKFPPNEPTPENIEQLVFPSSELIKSGKENQEYCLILTDDNGVKFYGFCRRVLPENSEMCLPMAYCIVSATKALGFYQKILKEIESRHGQSEAQLMIMLRNIQATKIPSAGKYLHVKLPLSIRPKTLFSSNHKISPKRLSLEANPKWLTESATQAAFADSDFDSPKSTKRHSGVKSLMEEFEDKKHQQAPFDLSLINRSLIARDPRFDEILIRRPNDIRLENTELSDILECLGPELLINVFASLLHERKVILQGKNMSLISKAILALDTILYPFQWQYTIVTILPQSLVEICQAPFPVLAGVLEKISFEIEDGILIDMDSKQIVQCCGDEQMIIPDSLRKSLQLSLEMVDLIDQGKMLSSVLISESFLRFFVELFANINLKRFHKDDFIQSHHEQTIKFFLEWFLETSMFRHFYNARYEDRTSEDVECDNFYILFDARVMEKSENSVKTSQNIETIVKNSKIINKKGKTFRDRFKHFLS